ncbi:hypothetical protein DXA21_22465, partial [Parabacteroides distasonis]
MNDNQIDNAIEHFEKSDNKYSWYNLGKIYMDFEKSDNKYSWYNLGKIYMDESY